MAKTFRLDAEALAKARASQVLAIEPSVFGGLLALSDAEPAAPPVDETGVAVISIEGPLAQRAIADLCGYVDGYDAITARVAAAYGDARVGAIVLRIDSPGGDGAGLEEAVARMRRMRDDSGKATFVYVDEQAASAAYWIAALLADEGNLVLPASGEVGSIGVWTMRVDATKQLEQAGIGVKVYREPAGKAEAHPYQPVAELVDERAIASVRDMAKRFFAAVGKARGLSTKAVAGFDGAMFGGATAVNEGLADAVGSLELVLGRAAKAAAQWRKRMNAKSKALAALKLSAEATDEQVFEEVAKLSVSTHALGAAVLERTAKTDPDAALATVDAWRDSHTRAAEERQDLAKQRAEQDKVRRRELLNEQIGLAWESPATTWANPQEQDPKKLEPKEPWASMSIPALEARLETLRSQPRSHGGPPRKPAGADGVEGLDAHELEHCKRKNLDPKHYAAAKARMNRRRGAQQETEN